METARGTFEVKLAPLDDGDVSATGGFGRMSIDKSFDGDLTGSSRGQMVAERTSVEGSAGYVALERVQGTVGGRSGEFVLVHKGVMQRGEGELTVTVVPDSGTDGLTGISGSMDIRIVDGRHDYVFRYALPGD